MGHSKRYCTCRCSRCEHCQGYTRAGRRKKGRKRKSNKSGWERPLIDLSDMEIVYPAGYSLEPPGAPEGPSASLEPPAEESNDPDPEPAPAPVPGIHRIVPEVPVVSASATSRDLEPPPLGSRTSNLEPPGESVEDEEGEDLEAEEEFDPIFGFMNRGKRGRRRVSELRDHFLVLGEKALMKSGYINDEDNRMDEFYDLLQKWVRDCVRNGWGDRQATDVLLGRAARY